MGDSGFDVDLGSEVVEQVEAKHAFSANIAVIRTADEMQQSLLDLIA
jgi:flagellar hook protein FlgE